jgi:hypothetical protein
MGFAIVRTMLDEFLAGFAFWVSPGSFPEKRAYRSVIAMSRSMPYTQAVPDWRSEILSHKAKRLRCLILLLIASLLLFNYQPTSSNERKDSFYYDCDFLSMQFFDSFFAIDGQKELLYALAPYKPNHFEEKDPELGVPANIVTRWNLRTGQCELKRPFTPVLATIIGISPNGQWLLMSTVSVSDPSNITPETCQYAYELFNTKTLEKVYSWSEKSLEPMEIVPPAHLNYVRDDELDLFLEREDPKTKRKSYYISEWQLTPDIRESRRLPISLPENHRLISLGRLDRNRVLCVTYLPPDKHSRQFPVYLAVYDLSKREITSCRKAIEVQEPPEGMPKKALASVLHEEIGWLTILLRPEHDPSGTFYLYDNKFQQVRSKQPPRDKTDQGLIFGSWSRDGKKLAFGFRRVAVYDRDKDEFRTIDTSLEELYESWSRPALFTKLARLAFHPLGHMLLTRARSFLVWNGLRFYPDNRRLVGMTTYGKVVIWDVDEGKVLKSFRIARNRHNAEMDRILGLE